MKPTSEHSEGNATYIKKIIITTSLHKYKRALQKKTVAQKMNNLIK